MFKTTEQAITVLKDEKATELDRVHAVHFLKDHPETETIDALISVLQDDDFGVRWAAGEALAHMGTKAAISVLRTIFSPDFDERLLESIRHVFKENGDILIRNDAEALIRALNTTDAIEAMTEANKLLEKWGH